MYTVAAARGTSAAREQFINTIVQTLESLVGCCVAKAEYLLTVSLSYHCRCCLWEENKNFDQEMGLLFAVMSHCKSSSFNIWFLLRSSVPPADENSAYSFSSELWYLLEWRPFCITRIHLNFYSFFRNLSFNTYYSIPALKGFLKKN